MKREGFLNAIVFVSLIGLFVLAANDWRMPWASSERPVDIAWCEAHEVELARCEICNPALARGGTQVVEVTAPQPGQCPNTCVRPYSSSQTSYWWGSLGKWAALEKSVPEPCPS